MSSATSTRKASGWRRQACPSIRSHHAGPTRHLGKVLGILLEEAEFLATLPSSSLASCDGRGYLVKVASTATGQLQTTRMAGLCSRLTMRKPCALPS